MKTVLTVKIEIPKRDVFLETMQQYSKSAQKVADFGFDRHLWNKKKLHDLTYYKIREETDLPAQLVRSNGDFAYEALKAVFKSKHKTSKPAFKGFSTIRYDACSFSFNSEKRVVSLSTIRGRIKFKVNIPEYFEKCLSLDMASSRGNSRVVGIDLEINKLAITSDNHFFKSSKVKQKKSEFTYLRRKLQSKGTPSANTLKKLSGKEQRFMRYVNHEVSKMIAKTVKAGDIVVMEELKGIRNQRKGRKFNRWLNNWSFYQLQKFIKYKAGRKGAEFVKVSAKNTSKRCSRCGSLDTSRYKGFFKCLYCGFTLGADLNASRNLAHSHMEIAAKAVVNQPYAAGDDAKTSFNEEKTQLQAPAVRTG